VASSFTPTAAGTGIKARIQRFGGHLAGMVMPNIAAFIAWGLITALFIPTGWIPNDTLAGAVDPMLKFLLPILIAYTGGKMIHGHRGGVVGAVATVGVVVGAGGLDGTTMLLGAMLTGPLTAYLLKLFDKLIEGRIKPGFEMLVDNFSAGILAGGMALLGIVGIGPVVKFFTEQAGDAVAWLVNNHMLPVASVLVEPAKILFLNNAINHGVFGPLGAAEAADKGQSILFMIESNPGPGLGLLLAFMFFGPKALRPSTPAAIVIHFLGGIHEIYFPYVMMKPRLVLAMIAGGVTGVATFMVTGAGLVATPAPGSIMAFFAVTPKGGHLGMILGVVLAAAASFFVAAVLMGFGRLEKDEDAEEDLEAAADRISAEKAASKS
jgi:PTS system mannitol-specific IIC component